MSGFGGWRDQTDGMLARATIAKSARLSVLFRLFGDPRNLTISENVRIDDFTCFVCTGPINIGPDVHIGSFVKINGEGGVSIGAGAQISSGVQIYSVSDDLIRKSSNGRGRPKIASPIVIGSECIIGANCVVLPGATVGIGATVGANSTIKGRLPAWTVCAGSPAEPKKGRIDAD